MSETEAATIDRDELRALYDQAIAELDQHRDGRLTTVLYRQIGNSVFEAACRALSDTASGTKRLHTVAAAAGAGKTTFAYALLVALTRYAERHPEAPFGAVLVCNEILKVEDAYRELSRLIPGRFLVWSSEHDRRCKKYERLTEKPEGQSSQVELRRYPVAVVTHAMYLDRNGHHARTVIKDGNEQPRALTIIDERPDEVQALEITLAEAEAARWELSGADPSVKDHLDILLKRMQAFSYYDPNKLWRVGIEIEPAKIREELHWFGSDEAQHTLSSNRNILCVDKLFAFARALMDGVGWVSMKGVQPYFTWYQDNLIIEHSAGAVLLDASADVDGVGDIVSWRTPTECLVPDYSNMEIVHVAPLPRSNRSLRKFLQRGENKSTYVKWLIDVVLAQVQPGQKALIVCTKVLIEDARIPNWPEDDERRKAPKVCLQEFGWKIEGRKLSVTNWGFGIGQSCWRDADVVILADEFHLPRQVSIAKTQGYRQHKVSQGDLAHMTSVRSKASGVDRIETGNVLRHVKQMAMRGNARNYDQQGNCGTQRLVVACDHKLFVLNIPQLFPGANVVTASAPSDHKGTLVTKALQVLRDAPMSAMSINAKDIAEHLGKTWRSIASRIRSPAFHEAAQAMGWVYQSNKGNQGASFVRVVRAACSTAVIGGQRDHVHLGAALG